MQIQRIGQISLRAHDVGRAIAFYRDIVVGEPHRIARLADREVWLAHFRDSEDNMQALMSEVRG